MDKQNAIPEGFSVLPTQLGFDESVGPVYGKEIDGNFLLGFRAEPRHMNIAGSVHGGAIATFADWQVIPALKQIGKTPHTPTISLATEYLAPGKLGGWLEMHATLHKETGSLLFTAAEIYCDDELIARSTAIYRKFYKKSDGKNKG